MKISTFDRMSIGIDFPSIYLVIQLLKVLFSTPKIIIEISKSSGNRNLESKMIFYINTLCHCI